MRDADFGADDAQIPHVAALLADPLFVDDALADRFDMPALPATGDGESAVAIARKVADIAQGLAVLAERLGGQPPLAANDLAESHCVAFLETLFRIRRLRGRHLASLTFGEPAWDILLDLAVAQFWRRETSVTSLCIAADVPPTTALRWINNMTRSGMIVRRPCERDGRRSFLAAAPHIYQAMIAMAADALRTEQRVRSRYHSRLG
jgi:DNA-binding MarR family transcriptional regulator